MASKMAGRKSDLPSIMAKSAGNKSRMLFTSSNLSTKVSCFSSSGKSFSCFVQFSSLNKQGFWISFVDASWGVTNTNLWQTKTSTQQQQITNNKLTLWNISKRQFPVSDNKQLLSAWRWVWTSWCCATSCRSQFLLRRPKKNIPHWTTFPFSHPLSCSVEPPKRRDIEQTNQRPCWPNTRSSEKPKKKKTTTALSLWQFHASWGYFRDRRPWCDIRRAELHHSNYWCSQEQLHRLQFELSWSPQRSWLFSFLYSENAGQN